MDDNIPLLCSVSSPLSQTAVLYLQLRTDTSGDLSTDANQRALLLRIRIVLLAGRVLEYIFQSQRGIVTEEEYGSVSEEMSAMVASLTKLGDSYSIPFCGTVSMALW